MELLEGESLAARVKRVGRLPLRDAVEFTYQTASAVGAAHRQGIVHRDLKPDNLFIVPDVHEGDRERIKVLDFGIAKLQRTLPGDSVRTRTGTLMGTPLYMSPEQCRGTKAVDHRSDIYSLGLILHEMLAGRPPFVSEGFGEMVNMHLNVPPPPLRTEAPTVPESLETLVLKALAKDPDRRFQSMAELQQALKASSGGDFVVRGSSPDIGGAPTRSQGPTAPANPPPAVSGYGPTTLTTGVGEKHTTVPDRPRGRKGLVALLAGVIALGAGVVLLGPMLQDRMAGMADDPAAPPTTSPAPPPVAAVSTVKLTVETMPPGARVLAVGGGDETPTPLGLTPLSLTRQRETGTLQLRLEKDGYANAAQSLPLDRDGAITVTLQKQAAPDPQPPIAAKPRPKEKKVKAKDTAKVTAKDKDQHKDKDKPKAEADHEPAKL
jgi:serine/threonine-protein kinase